jgi:hypothetical protein
MFGCYCFFDVDAFLDNYSYFDHRFLDNQVSELEDKEYYQQEIKKTKNKLSN